MARAPQRILLIFARAPVAGQCKTRLVPELGEAGAARFQARLTRSVIEKLSSGDWQLQLWCAPDSQHAFFQQLQRDYALPLFNQQGKDLGRRMQHAFSRAFRQARHAVIIGTDCPLLDAARLEDSFVELEAGRDAVLTPAEDGGYVMLGLNKLQPGLFTGIEWGSDQVCRQTLQAMQEANCNYALRPALWDIDHPADYRRLLAETDSGLA